MAKVVVLSSAGERSFDPWKHGTTLLLRHSAELDVFGEHKLVEDPEEADIILFGEMGECGLFAERVRARPVYRRFPGKCFLFDSGDTLFPVLPGIYASLTNKHYRRDHTRTGFYLYVIENPFIRAQPLTGNEKHLASFVGSSTTHPLRQQILAMRNAGFLLRDTQATSYRMNFEADPRERAPFYLAYADAMASARFSLCPRGVGAASIRLFESMKMGRACVILSDAWHPNDGVDWASFSIRVPEAEVFRIPQILEEHADRAAEMGLRARAEWEKWFSEKVRFHRVVELCLDIQRTRGSAGRARRIFDLRHIPLHPRVYLRSKRILYRNNHRIYW
jgi:Exostosin family